MHLFCFVFQTTINLDFSSGEVNPKEITAEIIGPECNKVECRLTLGPSGGRGTFVPMQVGMHKVPRSLNT